MKPHTFAVCAYRDSPYLEACIRSLKGQSVPSDIILCTSTPSPYIMDMADKYGIPVHVREGKSSIMDDWNFAYHMADSSLVTIAHQDDLYQKDYGKLLLESWKRYPDMTLFTGGYTVVKGDTLVKFEKVEFVKRFLRLPPLPRPLFRLRAASSARFYPHRRTVSGPGASSFRPSAEISARPTSSHGCHSAAKYLTIAVTSCL